MLYCLELWLTSAILGSSNWAWEISGFKFVLLWPYLGMRKGETALAFWESMAGFVVPFLYCSSSASFLSKASLRFDIYMQTCLVRNFCYMEKKEVWSKIVEGVLKEQTSSLSSRISPVSLFDFAAPSSMQATLSANLSVLIVSPNALTSGFMWTNISVLACPPIQDNKFF